MLGISCVNALTFLVHFEPGRSAPRNLGLDDLRPRGLLRLSAVAGSGRIDSGHRSQ